ncbi:hypothetical protein AMECASPLE_021850 [Ameca splendens]|uniref:Ig-like domain-containing protein n=2 Tax=Goodeidae TaxID=28758 RepID=A0ABV0XGT3_9TELE
MAGVGKLPEPLCPDKCNFFLPCNCQHSTSVCCCLLVDAPSVSEGRDAGVTLGQRGVLECEADAVPEADFEWYKDNRRVLNGFDDIEIFNTGSLSKLTFYNVSDGDYGNYTCVAVNKLGSSNTSFLLYVVTEPTSSTLLQGPRAVQDGSGGAKAVHIHTCLLFVAFLPFLLRF